MEFLKILKDKETENIEFKSSLSEKRQIGETISAFSNNAGGEIFVGINDDAEIIGVTMGSRTLEDLANYIIANTDPRFYASIEVKSANGRDIIVIKVPESDEKPLFFRGRSYIRMGRTNQILSAAQVREFIENGKHRISWDEKVYDNASLEDIDGNKVKWFLENAESERNRNIYPKTPVKEALNKLELLKDDSLTNAALLLFGENPQKFFLQAITKCARFKGTEALDFDDMKVFDGNIFDQREDSLNFVMKHIRHSAAIKGTERVEKFEYPPEAIREAITNAICHRDYGMNSNVQVRIFDDRLEIWGCGPLPGTLTIDDLKVEHNSFPRNKLIAKCFFDIKFIEHWGTGTIRMIQSCIDQGLPEPLFEIKSGNVVVTLKKYRITNEILSTLNERQRKAIDYLVEYGKITNREYREVNPNISSDMALKDLKKLVNSGILKPMGGTRARYYIFS
jgi:ATP-dependent DNA helicase RecG